MLHFLDDQGDSDYYQRKEIAGHEMEEREKAADNDVQQQEVYNMYK